MQIKIMLFSSLLLLALSNRFIPLCSCSVFSELPKPKSEVSGFETKFLPKTPVRMTSERPTTNFFTADDSEGTYMDSIYYGSWTSGRLINQFNYFTQQSGFGIFINSGVVDDVFSAVSIFQIYDGTYKDQKSGKITLTYNFLEGYDEENSTVTRNSTLFNVSLFENSVFYETRECLGDFMLSWYNINTGAPSRSNQDYYDDDGIYIRIESPACEISIQGRVSLDDSSVDSQAMYYAILITMICFTHLFACMQLIRQLSLNEVDGARYSLITVSIFTAWDMFLCFFHFYGSLVANAYFHYFITPAFWYFILASILEARLLGLIWKAKYSQTFQTIEEFRRGINCFYATFYLFIIGFVTICSIFLPDSWVFYVSSIFFVPQIIHNAMRGQKYQFDYGYVMLLGFTRIILPLYAKGYPNSLFKLTPNGAFVVSYLSIVLFQIFILYIQSRIGSRFFVPSCLLPHRYNYFKNISVNASTISDEEQEVCSICMDNLANVVSSMTTDLINKKLPDQIKVMQTPCKHMFHEECLKGWMDVKLECPFCRTPLPAID